jgi:nucleotide-binding universal stress UspA family protein
MFKHILIPTDGSAVAAKAIKAGVALAKEMGASVTAYYAIEPLPARLYSEGRIIDRNLIDELDRKALETAENSVRQVSDAASEAGVSCDTVIDRLVNPYRGIIDAATEKKCDAVVMASHGYSGLQELLLGSVTHKVLTHSKIPVLVYR